MSQFSFLLLLSLFFLPQNYLTYFKNFTPIWVLAHQVPQKSPLSLGLHWIAWLIGGELESLKFWVLPSWDTGICFSFQDFMNDLQQNFILYKMFSISYSPHSWVSTALVDAVNEVWFLFFCNWSACVQGSHGLITASGSCDWYQCEPSGCNSLSGDSLTSCGEQSLWLFPFNVYTSFLALWNLADFQNNGK